MLTLYYEATTTVRDPTVGGDTVESFIKRLDIDAVMEISHSVSANVTSHAVDEGIPVSDNSRPSQDIVTITCMHSASPSSLSVDGAELQEIEGGSGSVIKLNDDRDRPLEMFTEIRRLIREGVEVETEGLRYDLEGYIISNMSSPRTVEYSGALEFTIELKEIRKASTEEIDAPAPRVERGRRRVNRGNTASRNTDTSTTVSNNPNNRESSESFLHSLLNR